MGFAEHRCWTGQSRLAFASCDAVEPRTGGLGWLVAGADGSGTHLSHQVGPPGQPSQQPSHLHFQLCYKCVSKHFMIATVLQLCDRCVIQFIIAQRPPQPPGRPTSAVPRLPSGQRAPPLLPRSPHCRAARCGCHQAACSSRHKQILLCTYPSRATPRTHTSIQFRKRFP